MKQRYFLLKRTHVHDRLCTLADGVYAVALTLLVLDLKIPEIPGLSDPQLSADLFQQIPNFVAYTVAFFVIGFFWMNHHRIFESVVVCNKWALQLNLIHLFFISLTPYSTSLIGHYEEDRIATIFFSANLGLASLSLSLLASYVLPQDDKGTDASDGTWMEVPWWEVYVGPGIAMMSIMISFVSTTGALLLWLFILLKYAFLVNQISLGTPHQEPDE